MGDHIKARRAGGLYTHHAIDMGDGTVVHFSGNPVNHRAALVCRIPMEDFLDGSDAVVVEHREPVLPAEDTVRLAESLIGTRGYHPLTNNCEHFTTYCKTGRKNSPQARRFVKAAAAAGALALVAGFHLARHLRRRHGQRDTASLARALQQPKKRQKRT